MRLNQAIYITLFVTLVDSAACISSKAMNMRVLPPSISDAPTNIKETIQPINHSFTTSVVKIPLRLPSGTGELNADFYKPKVRPEKTTLLIIVPGGGRTSRKGEVLDDGIKSYEMPLMPSEDWAKALAQKGFFVLSYDKRSCKSAINPLCANNEQRDLDEEGIGGFAKDLDQVYTYAVSAFHKPDMRVVLLSSTQGAQVLALAECAKTADGIVLLSPIVENLENMWIAGLDHTYHHAPASEKNQWLNRKESMQAFFNSLKKGDFPETATVRGASVKFWLSWMDASKNTLAALKDLNRPVLLVFSEQDNFTNKEMIKTLQNQAKRNKTMSIKTYGNTDRNFTSKQGVPLAALNDITNFIESMPINIKL